MKPEVSYAKQTVSSPNPLARFPHRARHATALGLATEAVPRGGALLDFGCGDGHFLRQCAQQRPGLKLFGFDPGWKGGADGYAFVSSLRELPDRQRDAICAFEVLEHLYDPELTDFFEESRRLLRPGGLWILSVQIIGEPTLVLKEINPCLLFRRRSEYTAAELFRASLLGIPAPRAIDRRSSHKGFDFHGLEEQLAQEGKIRVRHWSPFPWAPWWANSQAFYVVEFGS
ncbi:MAG: class I SAM-dependent methyltransferase [Methylacidiphilaceae bacterium]|nr:class I SAM-dependent methyltransferase [Candidatus Methylacidiphilaceae bacterium]